MDTITRYLRGREGARFRHFRLANSVGESDVERGAALGLPMAGKVLVCARSLAGSRSGLRSLVAGRRRSSGPSRKVDGLDGIDENWVRWREVRSQPSSLTQSRTAPSTPEVCAMEPTPEIPRRATSGRRRIQHSLTKCQVSTNRNHQKSSRLPIRYYQSTHRISDPDTAAPPAGSPQVSSPQASKPLATALLHSDTPLRHSAKYCS
jgi:hypothetical protein